MNHNLLGCSHQYVALHEGNPVAFCAMTRLVHDTIKNAMRLHRLVVSPDYQGIGIGPALLDFVADIYKREGQRITACFSHPALLQSLAKNENWRITRQTSHAAAHRGSLSAVAGSCRRLTVGWEYLPELSTREA